MLGKRTETAVLGGGCFWCLDAAFRMIEGVKSVTSGYAGGDVPNPSYEEVCRGDTNHAEVVKIEFDPKKVTFVELLNVFFTIHDPTTLNRQGNDVGSQYRSIILFTSESQKEDAKRVVDQIEKLGLYPNRVVTEIKELDQFYLAEDEHQNYFEKHPDKTYCMLVIRPKIEKLKKIFGGSDG